MASFCSLPPGARAGRPRLAGTLALPFGPRAGHRRGRAAEWRSVPKHPVIKYRRRKGWEGYRELTGLKLASGTRAPVCVKMPWFLCPCADIPAGAHLPADFASKARRPMRIIAETY